VGAYAYHAEATRAYGLLHDLVKIVNVPQGPALAGRGVEKSMAACGGRTTEEEEEEEGSGGVAMRGVGGVGGVGGGATGGRGKGGEEEERWSRRWVRE